MACPIFSREFFTQEQWNGVPEIPLPRPTTADQGTQVSLPQLPSEVWLKIFLQTIDLRRTNLSNPREETQMLHIPGVQNYGPWKFRQVCQMWRNTIINSSALWNHIQVFLDLKPGDTVAFTLQWLRDRVMSFSPYNGPIFLQIDPVINDPSMEGLEGLLQTSLASRLRSLQCSPRIRDFIHHFEPYRNQIGGTGFSFPTLETLEIYPFTEDIDGLLLFTRHYRKFLQDTKSAFPNLKTLRLVGTGEVQTALALPIQWSTLTRFHYHNTGHYTMDYDVLLPVLEMCHQLMECVLKFTRESHSRRAESRKAVTLPQLRTLVLGIVEPSQLDVLITPALKDFYILRRCRFPLSEIVSLVDRSSCTVERFYEGVQGTSAFWSADINEDRVIDLSNALHQVKEIQTSCTLFREAFKVLGDSPGVIFPHLTSLGCDIFDNPRDIIHALTPQLGHRNTGNPLLASGLTKLRLHNQQYILFAGGPPLERAEAEELSASVSAEYGVEMTYTDASPKEEAETFKCFLDQRIEDMVSHDS